MDFSSIDFEQFFFSFLISSFRSSKSNSFPLTMCNLHWKNLEWFNCADGIGSFFFHSFAYSFHSPTRFTEKLWKIKSREKRLKNWISFYNFHNSNENDALMLLFSFNFTSFFFVRFLWFAILFSEIRRTYFDFYRFWNEISNNETADAYICEQKNKSKI